MDWRRSCSLSTMQVARPGDARYEMPIAWYRAPAGAKTYYGEQAFSAGLWDRDTPSLPPEVGEQPPYARPYSRGENVWGYIGQCVVGTPDQFLNGLDEASLAAPPVTVPACCAPQRTGQTWFLKHNLTPPQSVVPGVFLGSNWTNLGAAATAGLLDDTPGSMPEGPTFPTHPPPVIFGPQAFLQFLTRPLPAQTIPTQTWRFSLGTAFISTGTSNVKMSWTLSVVDGSTGLQRSEIIAGEVIGSQPLLLAGFRAFTVVRTVLPAVIEFGDYLCLEVGWSAGSVVFPAWTFSLQIIDSGTDPIPDGGSLTPSPMSLLAYPPTPLDPDMPLPGTIIPYASSAVPAGYLPCDGAAYSSASFSALFTAIGTTWGTGGPATFRVPDLRGRSPLGTSPGGLGPDRPSARVLAGTGGEEVHSLTILELAAHDHPILDPGHSHQAGDGGNFLTDQFNIFGSSTPNDYNLNQTPNTTSDQTGINVLSTGAGAAHNTLHPFAVVQWLIKT